MSSDPSDADSNPIPKELRPQPAKWLAKGILIVSLAIGGTISKAFGDSIFDELVAVLGKRLLLMSGLVLICSLGYCIYLLLKRRKLVWQRSLYWEKGDAIPFCAHCYESKKLRIHLNRFQHVELEKNLEAYSCSVCEHVYVSENEKDFLMSP